METWTTPTYANKRKLREYLLDDINCRDDIDAQLCHHFHISYLFDVDNLYGGYSSFTGSEIYDGCSDMIDRVVTDVFGEHDKLDTITKTKFTYRYEDFNLKEHFFDELVVVIHAEKKDDINSSCVYNDECWDNEILSYVEIHIYDVYELDTNDFAAHLTHELIHNHENYLVRQFLKSVISTIDDVEVEEISRSLTYLKEQTTDLANEVDDTNLIKDTNCYLDKHKTDVFMQQLRELMTNDGFENSSDFLYKVSRMRAYQMYRKLYEESLKTNEAFSKLNIDRRDLSTFRQLVQAAWKKLIDCIHFIYIEEVEDLIREYLKSIGRKRKINRPFRCFSTDIPVWKRIKENEL